MKINLEIIKALNPCQSGLDYFIKHYPSFEGNHAEFLDLPEISHSDKLWVILRLMKRIDVETFATECAVRAANAYAYAYANATHAAANAYAYAYANAATAVDAERARQIEALIYLINKSEE